MKWYNLYIILHIFLLVQCKSNSDNVAEDILLAQVGNRSLYLSELKDLFPDNSSKADSNNILITFVDKWIRETILLNEAEKYIANAIDIDKLVEDYRESLLIHNYEEQLVEERLDTTITMAEKEEFYNQNKEAYKLVNPIIRVRYAKMPAEQTDIKTFKSLWIKQDTDAMIDFCQKYQLDHSFNDSNWITFANLEIKLPQELFSLSQIKSKKSLDKEYDGVQYFVKVLEYKDENEIAPLPYIEDKIAKVILYNRKINLLTNIKEKLYERELEFKRIKTYNLE